jgi:hypothetical protein
MNNAVLLKRAMKFLNLSGVALAERVSALREDGKRTAPETISRWLNGTNPVDPFLMGWISELVRSKLRDKDIPILRFPRNKGLIIAVTNVKGGVGTTTVAMNLAAIAKTSLRTTTTLLFADCPTRKDLYDRHRKDLTDLDINCPDLSLDEVLAYQPKADEVVLVDVFTSIVANSLLQDSSKQGRKANPKGFLPKFHPDVYVIPADFSSCFDVASSAQLLNSGALQAPVQLLHRTRGLDMDFAATALEGGLDVTSELFCPFFIPLSVSSASNLPRSSFGDWQNQEQEHYHYQLFEHLLEFLGGEITSTSSLIERMSLAGLLDLEEGRYQAMPARS